MPKGKVLNAMPSNQKLNNIKTIVNAEAPNLVNPCEYLRPTAHAISHKPAMKRIPQAMSHFPTRWGRPREKIER